MFPPIGNGLRRRKQRLRRPTTLPTVLAPIGCCHLGSTPADFNALQLAARRQLATAQQTEMRRREQDYDTWVTTQLKKGGGALHKLSTGKLKQPPSVCQGNCGTTDPLVATATKAECWASVWRVDHDDPDLQFAIEDLTAAAKEQIANEELEPLTDLRVWRAVSTADPKTPGADLGEPKLLCRQGFEGVDELADITRSAESSLSWPIQELLNLIALIPKDDLTDRPTALCATGCYKVWARLRKNPVH